eukprot:Skav203100  [mRNA]  locus=scaffold447:257564:260472:+ [translate_table: standard]
MEMMGLRPRTADGALPWWQDTLAINRHYRRLTRMIFTTLVMESNDPSQAEASLEICSWRADGASCAICLNEKSAVEDLSTWVQLPCEHVLHRSCFRELVSHNLFSCRCPLCRYDLVKNR